MRGAGLPVDAQQGAQTSRHCAADAAKPKMRQMEIPWARDDVTATFADSCLFTGTLLTSEELFDIAQYSAYDLGKIIRT